MTQLLVTGTGRCGTGYTAKLLTAAGVPCGHEEVFTPQGIVDRPDLEADASWCAVPFLDSFQGRVVHLVRHPLAVVRSFVGIGFFERDLHFPHRKFAGRHFERSGFPLPDAMRWWIEWNRRIEPYADVRIRVEDLPGVLPFIVDRRIRWSTEPSRLTNHRTRAVIEELPEGGLRDELEVMALRYGYELGEV